jgi:hypothetical protein
MKPNEGFGFGAAAGGCSRVGMDETLKKELKKLLGAKDDGFGLSRTSIPTGYRAKLTGAGWVEDVQAAKLICDGFGSHEYFERAGVRIMVLEIQTSARKSFSVRAIGRI